MVLKIKKKMPRIIIDGEKVNFVTIFSIILTRITAINILT